jgi:hypothetical protein
LGAVPEDYEFDHMEASGAPAKVRLSELFRPGTDILIIYHYMFPRHRSDQRRGPSSGPIAQLPLEEGPCPSCTALLDNADARPKTLSSNVVRLRGNPGKRRLNDAEPRPPAGLPGAPGITLALAINNRDQIVGAYTDSQNTKHGFLLEEGEFTAIDHPDATSEVTGGGTVLYGLNDRGRIVGQYSDSSCHGFLLDGDIFTTIDNPDALFATGAADINDRGQIVGFYDGGTGTGQCAQQAPPSASDPGSAAE